MPDLYMPRKYQIPYKIHVCIIRNTQVLDCIIHDTQILGMVHMSHISIGIGFDTQVPDLISIGIGFNTQVLDLISICIGFNTHVSDLISIGRGGHSV